MSKKISKFHQFIQVSIGEKQFLLLKLKIEFIDLSANLAELEVRKYVPSFPYWWLDHLAVPTCICAQTTRLCI